MCTQVLKYFFSASDIMEAVRGRFFCYLTTIPVELGFLWDFEVLKLKNFIMNFYFSSTFGSSHSASSAYQKWPTPIRCKEVL